MKFLALVAASAAVAAGSAEHNLEERDVVWVTHTNVVVKTAEVVKTVWVGGDGAGATGAQATQAAGSAPVPAAPKVAHPKPGRPRGSHPQRPKHGGHQQNPSSSSASTAGSAADTMSGDMTWYDVGLGSCGFTSYPSEYVVALSYKTMNNPANPNTNPLCRRPITIYYDGKTASATVVDTCAGCEGTGDLDMSTSLFEYFAPLSVGRITSGMTWNFA